ncbi:MAG: C10 family peptidase [Prevotella sp.]|nr:C10 family peptidase [Prevotella sp.]
MKRTLLICLVLFMTTAVMAGPITREQARQKAAQFLISRGKPAARSLSPARMKARNGAEITQYYVFNIGQRQGFVIVSGDDRTDAILGWADEGELTTDNMPDNLRAWLQGYADQLQWLSEHPDVPAQHASQRAAATTRQPVAPQMTSKWNQDNPYNYYAPLYDSEHKSAAGCVCTATCQVMYHRAKVAGITTTETLIDIPTYDKTFTGGTLSGQPATGVKPKRTFYWNYLRDTYTKTDDPETDTGAEEVARLMEYVGAALKMNYGESSGAYNEAIPGVLTTYFGYDADVVHVDRKDYLYEDWLNIIYTELTTNGPLVLGGSSTGGGHAFVCDGYQEEDYFHINWGWGGGSDGYFKLSVLYPSQQGIGGSTSQDGYIIDQDAIINIKPADDGISTPVPTPSASSSTTLTASMTQKTAAPTVGQPVTIQATINNTGSQTYSGSITLRTFSKLLAGQQIELAAGSNTTIELTFTPESAGTFTLLLRKSGSSENLTTLPITIASAGDIGTVKVSEVNVSSTTGGTDRERFTINYGKTFHATLTMTETAGKAYKGTVTVRLIEFTWTGANRSGSGRGPYISKQNYLLDLTGNGTQEIDIEYNGLSTSNLVSYAIEVYNFNNNTCNIISDSKTRYEFYCNPGITVYGADGTESTIAPATSYVTPADALAVDLSGITGVTSVTPNSNPNTLYFINSTDSPTGLDNKNVVVGGTCTKLTLTDGNGFRAPLDFTATEATYTRQFTVGADGEKGWSTIVLPFDVSQVKQGDKVIDWFHSSTDTGKHFWVKKFSSEEGSTINFDFATTMNADTPYIIAVPGDKWGDEWDLTDKDITFIGTGVNITADAVMSTNGYHYKFAGVTESTNAGTVYQLNNDGNSFDPSSAAVAPFRAYFKALGSMLGDQPQALSIGSEGNQPTAIQQVAPTLPANAADDATWYTLDGRPITHPTTGIYIKNGKKIIIK